MTVLEGFVLLDGLLSLGVLVFWWSEHPRWSLGVGRFFRLLNLAGIVAAVSLISPRHLGWYGGDGTVVITMGLVWLALVGALLTVQLKYRWIARLYETAVVLAGISTLWFLTR